MVRTGEPRADGLADVGAEERAFESARGARIGAQLAQHAHHLLRRFGGRGCPPSPEALLLIERQSAREQLAGHEAQRAVAEDRLVRDRRHRIIWAERDAEPGQAQFA